MTARTPPLPPAAAEAAEDCSALLDGATGKEATVLLLRRLGREPLLRRRFARYALISSALKGQLTDLSLDGVLADRVGARLPAESAPEERWIGRRLSWVLAGGLAVAAFSTLVVRGIVVLPSPGGGRGARPVAVETARSHPVRLMSYGNPGRATWRRGAPAERRVLDEYLLTHLAAPGYAPVMVHARLATYEVTMAGRGPRPGRP